MKNSVERDPDLLLENFLPFHLLKQALQINWAPLSSSLLSIDHPFQS